MNRRDTFGLALLAVAPMSARALSARARPTLPGLYTAPTAPDAASRAILRAPLQTLYSKSAVGSFADQIHANFVRATEQNFASLGPERMVALMRSLSDAELAAVAHAYTTAATELGKPMRALDVMAARLSPVHLGRVVQSFGFEPVYSAVTRVAPEKANAVLQASDVNAMAPVASRIATPTLAGKVKPMVSAAPFFDYTIYEIYLSFRTAPIGALAPAGAAYETMTTVFPAIGLTWATSYAAGSGLAWVLQNYAPNLYDAIGGTIDNMIDKLWRDPTSIDRAHDEKNFEFNFDLGPIGSYIENTGGDYFSAPDLYAEYGGGGSSRCWDCVLI